MASISFTPQSGATLEEAAQFWKDKYPPKKEPPMITGLPASKKRTWVPNPEASIARLTYDMTTLPALWIVSVEFHELKSGKSGREDEVWEHVYSRRATSKAMDELLETLFLKVKDIVAINRQTRHNHIDIIFSSRGVSLEAKSGIIPQYIELDTTRDDNDIAKPMRARITGVLDITGRETKDLINEVYRQSVTTIVQSRLSPSLIPGLDRTVCRHEMNDFPVFEETGERVSPSKGKTGISRGDEVVQKLRERGVRLRSSVTVVAFKDARVLHVHFDAVVSFPGLKTLAEILRHVFPHNPKPHHEFIRQMFSDLWVVRVKVPNDDKKWTRPFQIKNVVSDGHINHLISDGDTVYEYFQTRYGVATNPAFPLISDGLPDTVPPIPGQRKSWFPMEGLRLAFEQPLNNKPLVTSLKNLIDDSNILYQDTEDAKGMFEGYAKTLIERIAKPKTPETLDLLKVDLGNPTFNQVDAIGHQNLELVDEEARKRAKKRGKAKLAKAKKRALAALHSAPAPSII